MEEKTSSASSTPSSGYWKMGSSTDVPTEMGETPGVPSPVLPSELTYNDQSTILESSMGDCSTTVMYDPSQNDTTMQELSTSNSPVCSRTRSHDGSMTIMSNFRTTLEVDELKKELELNISKNEAQPDNQEEERYSMTTEGIEIMENTGKKEVYQHGYSTEIAQTKKLLEGITTLQDSNQKLGILLKEEEENETGREKFKMINNNLILQAREYPIPPKSHEVKIKELEDAIGLTYIKKTWK